MATPGERNQILEKQIKELQERLKTSDAHLKAILEKKLRLSEVKIKILEQKVIELEKELKACVKES